MDTGADRIKRNRRDLVEQLDAHVGKLIGGGVEAAIDEVRLFLQQELMPLVEAGESDLVPGLERVSTQSPVPSATSLDLTAIRRYVRDVEEIMYKLETGAHSDEREQLKVELTEKAIRLQAVVELHVEKESEIYLPSLEVKLPEPERRRILQSLEAGRRVIKLPDTENV